MTLPEGPDVWLPNVLSFELAECLILQVQIVSYKEKEEEKTEEKIMEFDPLIFS